jgi:membrane protein DedA with SNARE-associated domain
MHLLSHGDILHWVSTYGYLAVGVIVALESLGLPLPGETALIAASIAASTSHGGNIWLVISAAGAGAIVGDNIGYLIGRAFGSRLLINYGHYVRIQERRIKLGRYLFLRYGGAVVFFGRFVALLRALAALLAGANCMPWSRFLLFNAAGGIAWALVYGFGAYYLGREVSRLGGPVAAGVSIFALAAIAGTVIIIHRREEKLIEKAEAALPGPVS